MKLKQLAILLLLISTVHGFGQFKFNEFSCANTSAIPSDPLAAGQYNGSPDWVEIYNSTISPTTFTLTGWYLSDDRNNLRKWQFPFVNNLPLKVDTHHVVVIYLCGHDKAVSNAGGVNASSIGIDLHANFGLNQTKPGTKLYLTKTNGLTAVDSIDITKYKNKPGHSWGRAQTKPSATNPIPHWITTSTWRLYSTVTPGQINPDTTSVAPTAWYFGYCPTPKIDLQPGFYNGSLPTLNVTDTAEGVTTSLWYNINKVVNSSGNAPYSGIEIYGTNDCSIPIFSNSQSQLIASAGTSGTPLTGTFATPNNANTPVSMVRIMTHDANTPKRWLDGFEFYGAYVIDTLKRKMSLTCVCVDTAKLFEQAVPKDSTAMVIDYFGKNYKEVFRNQGQGHVGKIDFYNSIGSAAMKNKQWQFVFRSEDEYGYHYTNLSQFFTDQTLGLSNRSDFPEIMFRSAAKENFLFPGVTAPTSGFKGAHIRDFYNHTISLRHNLRFDASHYVPTYMVINGWPKGIYYVKETIDSLYTNYYYNRPRAAILANTTAGPPQVTVSGLAVPTASTQWSWFYNWAMLPGTNVHNPTLYYRLSDSLDFNSLNDYMAYNFLSVNSDYVKRYAMWWRGLPTDTADHRSAKWRFALTSTDYTWGFDAVNSNGIANTTPTSDPCDYLTAAGINYTLTANPASNPQYPIVPLWFKLMKNDTFKSEFITRYSDLLNSALSCDSLEDHLKYVRSLLVASDMASHVWWTLSNQTTCASCDSVKYWNAMLDSMKIFIAQRCTLVSTALTNCFPEISGPYNLCIDVSPVNSGYVKFNSLTLKNFIWNGRYFDSIINVIKGIPYQNYVFDHWETNYNVHPNKTSDSATFYIPTDGCIKAIFKLRPPNETYGTPMLPTGFSPNADGNNDILNVYGIAEASGYELEIYNRWGEQVFHSVNKAEGWDGKFNGTDAPAGVYGYRYNIILNGKTYASKGNVTLVR
ncbi:MAG TPA: gliding motility-associated C-terminal domain-containing protein [Bacteroidia bacterium]|nr:gliding motility-associated C-terminal domain-containing protein [Bacteroidia bacterium]